MEYSKFNSYEQALAKLDILGYNDHFQFSEDGKLKCSDGSELDKHEFELEFFYRFGHTSNIPNGVTIYGVRTFNGHKGVIEKTN